MSAQCQFILANPNGHSRRCLNLVAPPYESMVLCHLHKDANARKSPQRAWNEASFHWAVRPIPTLRDPHPKAFVVGSCDTETDARKAVARALVSIGVPDRMAAQIARQTEPTWTDFPTYKLTTLIQPK